jgi:hypothetical protein
MNIKYYQETKVTKKNDPKCILEVTEDGFISEEGELKTYWDFFKDFAGSSINISVTTSVKADLVESQPEEYSADEDDESYED